MVQKNFIKVSKLFEICFEGMEQKVLSLLTEMEIRFLEIEREKRRVKKSGNTKGEGGCRELKGLEWSLNYEGSERS